MTASISIDGTVRVDGKAIGSLNGFTLSPIASEKGENTALLSAASTALADEIKRRVQALSISADPAFSFDHKGDIIWRETHIARLVKSDALHAPQIDIYANELLNIDQTARIKDRLEGFTRTHIDEVLAPLIACGNPDQLFITKTASPPDNAADSTADNAPPAPQHLSDIAKTVLRQLYENMGVISRRDLHQSIAAFTETDKAIIARAGIRIGMENLFLPILLKPAPIALRLLLWRIYHRDDFPPDLPPEGRVSFVLPEDITPPSQEFWQAAGYRQLGRHIMRVDMIERVSALMRAAARTENLFEISDEMLSLAGVGREDMARILIDLGCKQTQSRSPDDPTKPEILQFQRIYRKSPKARQQPNKKSDAEKQPKRSGAQRSGGKMGDHRSSKTGGVDPNSPFAILAKLKR